MKDIIGSKTAVKILNVLFGNPSREFKKIELVDLAKTGRGSAFKLIDAFIKEKFVICKKIGKSEIVKFNLSNESAMLMKFSFGIQRLRRLPTDMLATIMALRERIKDEITLMIIFGSHIAGTATDSSDIDVLVVAKNSSKIDEQRKEAEEISGKRINLHIFDKNEILKQNGLFRNALLSGIVIYGYDSVIALLKSLKKESLERIEYLLKRHKSAARNYISKDYESAEAIVENILEQLVFLLLSRENIPYASKRDAMNSAKKLPEGKAIENIKKTGIKQKIESLRALLTGIYSNSVLGETNA